MFLFFLIFALLFCKFTIYKIYNCLVSRRNSECCEPQWYLAYSRRKIQCNEMVKSTFALSIRKRLMDSFSCDSFRSIVPNQNLCPFWILICRNYVEIIILIKNIMIALTGFHTKESEECFKNLYKILSFHQKFFPGN